MKTALAESLLWAGVSLCVVLVIVFGSMIGNMNMVSLADIVRPLTVLGVFAVLTTLGLMAFSPPLGRVFPAALYGYFAFFHIQHLLPDFGYRHIVAYAAIVVAPLALHLVLRTREPMRAAAFGLAVTAVMASVPLGLSVPSLFYPSPPTIAEDFHDETLAAVTRYGGGKSALPDVIYVVPDRYPSTTTLIREFGVDNGPFYAALEARGFVVADNAHANYPKTFQSLASTLNGGYLENFTAAHGIGRRDQRPVFDALEKNVAQDRLRDLGYRFHNYGNGWEPTRINRWADVNDTGSGLLNHLSEFEAALIGRTPTWDVVGLFKDVWRKSQCHRIRRKLRLLEEVGNRSEPVFVFAHILIPHEPITMDASGRCLDPPVRYSSLNAWGDYKAAFIEYLRYFNSAVLRVIDRQIERRRPNGRGLLFVIQSDEGPFPRAMRRTGEDYDFNAMTRRELQMKMGTINALRLPPGKAFDPASIATPVNNWRIIFNALSGSSLKMLPHRIYIYPSAKNIYQFCDVTALVTGEEESLPGLCPE